MKAQRALELRRSVLTQRLRLVAAPEHGDEGDVANSDQDRTLLFANQEAMRTELQAIEDALERIRVGQYGRCLNCGLKIPRARLEALPYATSCVPCLVLSGNDMRPVAWRGRVINWDEEDDIC